MGGRRGVGDRIRLSKPVTKPFMFVNQSGLCLNHIFSVSGHGERERDRDRDRDRQTDRHRQTDRDRQTETVHLTEPARSRNLTLMFCQSGL